uniref:DUF7870 domain-containing protein n=1 Tax=Eutreptiella gymnastica TaxID=73025 RepID=A0A7S1IA52_9EUGL
MPAIQARLSKQLRLGSLVPLAQAPRRVYLDFGARDWNSSVAVFLRTYPQARTFELKAWEVVEAFRPTYASHSEVELHMEAVWVADGQLQMRDPRMAHVLPANYSRVHRHKHTSAPIFVVPSVDISAYLQRNFVEDDFVVCKMDIEGAEYTVIPKLVADGTIHLIDELMLECHYWAINLLPTVRSRTWRSCFQMYAGLRSQGVYVHEWF